MLPINTISYPGEYLSISVIKEKGPLPWTCTPANIKVLSGADVSNQDCQVPIGSRHV